MVEEDAEELVNKYTREELDRIAVNEHISDPDKLPNKKTVALEIVKARKTKKYMKKPAGLYLNKD